MSFVDIEPIKVSAPERVNISRRSTGLIQVSLSVMLTHRVFPGEGPFQIKVQIDRDRNIVRLRRDPEGKWNVRRMKGAAIIGFRPPDWKVGKILPRNARFESAGDGVIDIWLDEMFLTKNTAIIPQARTEKVEPATVPASGPSPTPNRPLSSSEAIRRAAAAIPADLYPPVPRAGRNGKP